MLLIYIYYIYYINEIKKLCKCNKKLCKCISPNILNNINILSILLILFNILLFIGVILNNEYIKKISVIFTTILVLLHIYNVYILMNELEKYNCKCSKKDSIDTYILKIINYIHILFMIIIIIYSYYIIFKQRMEDLSKLYNIRKNQEYEEMNSNDLSTLFNINEEDKIMNSEDSLQEIEQSIMKEVSEEERPILIEIVKQMREAGVKGGNLKKLISKSLKGGNVYNLCKHLK